MTTRHRIGTLDELREGEGKRLEIGGHRVAVFRRGARVFAVGDSCPHMGASLSDGYLDAGSVICPWHGWVFDLESGISPFDEDCRIPVYRAMVEDGAVFLELEAAAGSPDPCPAEGRTEER